jgi:hypothetical protein
MIEEKDMIDIAINNLFDAIGKDYAQWRSRGEYGSENDYGEMVDNLHIEEGRKYLKVVKKFGDQEMVWGFIVKEDEPKKEGKWDFKAGDILKAATWSAPARNKPRGNILQGDFSWVRWTGPEYL